MVQQAQHSWYFVCTGNICRSAFAEAYLQRLFNGVAAVNSGGTGVNQALAPTEEIKTLAARQGLSLDEHTPRFIEGEELKAHDIVLTATVAHRAQVLAEAPTLLNRVFTIKEFAQLLPHIDVEEIQQADPSKWWRAAARKASQLRSRVNAPGNDLDIVDPFKKDMDVYIASTQEIMDALDVIANVEHMRASRA
ncbi:hypothetical protein [Rothia nasimurium]|uniref:arsenate reductase/protein-tyrosine-phosphatase family protein n=1 Tax=Rothia nasimurium TaxID=85336 RepID=UPI001F17C90F|nr:hypothetical protein [Rothia nasimurium]